MEKFLEIRAIRLSSLAWWPRCRDFTPTIENMQDYQLYADTSAGSIFLPDRTWPIVYQFDEPQSVAVQAKNTDAMTRAGKMWPMP